MEKIWLKSYPKGVPAEIDVNAYRSIPHLFDANIGKYRERPAYVCMGKTITFGDVDRLSTAFGAWLQSLDLERGSRVAVMMPNVPQYLVAIAGILRAGHVVVNVNPLYTARELEHQLKDSGARVIVVLENFAHTLEEVLDRTEVQHVMLASMGELLGFWRGRLIDFAVRHVRKMVPEFALPLDGGRTVTRFSDAVSQGSRVTLRRVDVAPDDVAFLQYTGGTTGVSKGVMLTHGNIVGNVLQASAWINQNARVKGASGMPIFLNT